MIEAIFLVVMIHQPPESPGEDVIGLKTYDSYQQCMSDADEANRVKPPQYTHYFTCEKVTK